MGCLLYVLLRHWGHLCYLLIMLKLSWFYLSNTTFRAISCRSLLIYILNIFKLFQLRNYDTPRKECLDKTPRCLCFNFNKVDLYIKSFIFILCKKKQNAWLQLNIQDLWIYLSCISLFSQRGITLLTSSSPPFKKFFSPKREPILLWFRCLNVM